MKSLMALLCAAALICIFPAHAAPAADLHKKCAAACKACEEACLECNKHCTAMVKAGNKEHAKSVKLSADCRDICAVAARICARKGPMSVEICKACAAACDACSKECGKSMNMPQMAACKKACDECSKACLEMIGQK
jgi:hypothetical protein